MLQISNLTISTKKKGKVIVNDLSLDVKKGELFAILGPTGSGKTTLLDYICRIIRSPLRYSGEYKAEGKLKYVPQEDTLHGFYTVKQYLHHYISLNYGHSVQKEKYTEIIKAVAEETGLLSVLDIPIGDMFRKGISGGEKRKLSIALELIAKPDILILDEPTSGLDIFDAQQIMLILKRLSKEGVLVICTLHQPSSEIWSNIDRILLLSNGYNCYMGSPKGAEAFFSSIGKSLPSNYNPADFFMNQINYYFNKEVNPDDINSKYKGWLSNNPQLIDSEREKNENKISQESLPLIPIVPTRANKYDKFRAIFKRCIYNLIKNPGIVLIRLIMYGLLSLAIGLMFLKVAATSGDFDVVAILGLLFYVVSFLTVLSIAVLPFFLIERDIIQKEFQNQLYHPFYYQISMFLMSIPATCMISLLSSLFIVLMVQLSNFGIFFIILFLSLLAAEALTRMVSLLVPHHVMGMAVIAGLYGMFMLCEGYLVTKSNIPNLLIWIYYLGFHTYAYQGFVLNQYKNAGKLDGQQFPRGDVIIRYYGMEKSSVGNSIGILILFTVCFEIAIFIIMKIKFRKISK